MIIDEVKYNLDSLNYIEIESPKKYIVLTHSGRALENTFVKWKHRLGGKYTKTAHYSIDFKGNVFKHFEPIYCANNIGHIDFDKKSIIVQLENEGWLDVNKNNEFCNWIGDIYNRPDEIVEKKWRGYSNWAPYLPSQFKSALELVSELCDEFFIPKVAVPHNTKVDNLDDFSGVIYKSNIEKNFTDLSPAWNCEEFKYKLETK
jgi:N-acetylmuramoyl-L-alanine amidase